MYRTIEGGFKPVGVMLALLVSTSFHAQMASAQTADGSAATGQSSDGLEEIIVTAQRQSENIQKVPIAVTAITASQLAAKGVTSNAALEGAVPSLTVPELGAAYKPFLRGVGSDLTTATDEPAVATYVDGFYIPQVTGNFLSLNNVQRIEVLKGPQGTLFGRNATGGVIQVITRDPSYDPHMELEFGYGNYQTVDVGAYVTGGLSDKLSADLAVQYSNQMNGYGTNLSTGKDIHTVRTSSIRSKWKLEASDNDTLTLILNYNSYKSDGEIFNAVPGQIVVNPLNPGSGYAGRYNALTNSPNGVDQYAYGVGFRYEHESDWGKFVSSTGYTYNTQDYFADTDLSAQPLIVAAILPTAKSLSQEFQLMGKSGRLDWQVGAFLFQYKGQFDLLISGDIVGGSNLDTFTSTRTRSAASYAQATYEVLDNLKLTAGIRYTKDWQRKAGTGFFGPVQIYPSSVVKQSASAPTWRLAANYQFTPSVMGYVSWNRGFKSGGLGLDITSPSFRPEKIDAYEVGLKSELFDRHVRFNIAAYLYDYSDLQVQVINSQGTGINTFNAATARMKGIDADLTIAPFENFTLDGGISLLNAKYRAFDGAVFYNLDGTFDILSAAGNRTPNAPKFSASGTATYAIPTEIGKFTISGTVIHKSVSYNSPDNRLAFPAYTLVNGGLSWTASDERLGASVWVKNLTNAHYRTALFQSVFAFGQIEAPPRTYGVKLNYKF